MISFGAQFGAKLDAIPARSTRSPPDGGASTNSKLVRVRSPSWQALLLRQMALNLPTRADVVLTVRAGAAERVFPEDTDGKTGIHRHTVAGRATGHEQRAMARRRAPTPVPGPPGTTSPPRTEARGGEESSGPYGFSDARRSRGEPSAGPTCHRRSRSCRGQSRLMPREHNAASGSSSDRDRPSRTLRSLR